MTVAQLGMLLVLACTLAEGAAQVCLKKSTAAASGFGWVGVGIALFIVQGIGYTCALRWLDISTAYPLGALSFVVVTLLSRWMLGEAITPQRWMGVGLIMAGCMMIAV